jgi:hypothetical protein
MCARAAARSPLARSRVERAQCLVRIFDCLTSVGYWCNKVPVRVTACWIWVQWAIMWLLSCSHGKGVVTFRATEEWWIFGIVPKIDDMRQYMIDFISLQFCFPILKFSYPKILLSLNFPILKFAYPRLFRVRFLSVLPFLSRSIPMHPPLLHHPAPPITWSCRWLTCTVMINIVLQPRGASVRSYHCHCQCPILS